MPPGKSSPHHSLWTPGPSLWPHWHVSKLPSLPGHHHPSDLPGLRLLCQPRNTERPGAGLSSQHSLLTVTLPCPKAAFWHEDVLSCYSHPHVDSDSRLNTWLRLTLFFLPNSNAVILQYYRPRSLCLIFGNTTIYQSHTQMNQILITSVIDTQK